MNGWSTQRRIRQRFATRGRKPFYRAAHRYLPNREGAVILDVGAGDGSFGQYLKEVGSLATVYALDGNAENAGTLRGCYSDFLCYVAPRKLAFADASVDAVHCSHLIEHLDPEELIALLREMDRVLKTDACLIISAPMIWEGFFENLTHVRPYHAGALLRYLSMSHQLHTRAVVSDRYRLEEILFRYRKTPVFEDLGGEGYLTEAAVRLAAWIFEKAGIRRYRKNGYTLVLRKTADESAAPGLEGDSRR